MAGLISLFDLKINLKVAIAFQLFENKFDPDKNNNFFGTESLHYHYFRFNS